MKKLLDKESFLFSPVGSLNPYVPERGRSPARGESAKDAVFACSIEESLRIEESKGIRDA